MDEVFVKGYSNTGVLESLQPSPQDFIDHEVKQEWREWAPLKDTALCTEALGELSFCMKSDVTYYEILKFDLKKNAESVKLIINIIPEKQSGPCQPVWLFESNQLHKQQICYKKPSVAFQHCLFDVLMIHICNILKTISSYLQHTVAMFHRRVVVATSLRDRCDQTEQKQEELQQFYQSLCR
ncbi:hypothetical protein CSKR_106589 [Clonorchis sinensis]|uniref:Uncharacterized protein n=1 Tax=Clonorchis sinensis TaxID=79923 RepID=A0A3R7F7B4_CLOSI|nr:hypothetical protein CSKR_106589 [Clonorchis sinensis]